MTTRLVYANITYVMSDERRKQTEQKLIAAGTMSLIRYLKEQKEVYHR